MELISAVVPAGKINAELKPYDGRDISRQFSTFSPLGLT
jgi:hypothetical protein